MSYRTIQALVSAFLIFSTGLATADDPPSSAGPIMKLLRSGKVPEANLGRILDLVCARGNEHDLAFVFSKVTTAEWPADVRVTVLENLLSASQNRNVQPAGELTGLTQLLADTNPEIQLGGLRLAREWKAKSVAEQLTQLVNARNSPASIRNEALSALTEIAPETARQTIDSILSGNSSFDARTTALGALASMELKEAAAKSAELFASATADDDPRPLIEVFLEKQNGSEELAAALETHEVAADVAKLALRHMYAEGRSDAKLNQILSKYAGIADEMPLPNAEELAKLVEEIRQTGDPARGEAVFRRSDLSCQKCHAVSKAGGQVGPDLSAVGATTPIEYLALSVLDPDQAVKEAYTTQVVLTEDGRVLQGIIADQTEETLVLKDPNGKLISIPRIDIEDQISGKSLMPKGLVKFMTHAEFVDLVSFLSQLGKPGRYAVRSTARMQRWELLTNTSAALQSGVPNVLQFEDEILNSPNWKSVYALVDGTLPLQELISPDESTLYVSGIVDVQKAGEVQLQGTLPGTPGITFWIGKEVTTESRFNLPTGKHRLTLRIDTEVFPNESVFMELIRTEGSTIQFSVVDGQ
ncbi:MAG: c-type cytochrome [Planctomycetaceae bacterium]|nr:c-type cytochrome [Planctomycetaceae bacterium]